MDGIQLWNTVKSAGSLVGLCTGAYVLADRLFGVRPYAAWVKMERHTATLLFVNASGRHIYLERMICWPPNAATSRFGDPRETMADHWKMERTLVLPPNADCTATVTWRRDGRPQGFTVVIANWRRADALFAVPIIKIANWAKLQRLQDRDPYI